MLEPLMVSVAANLASQAVKAYRQRVGKTKKVDPDLYRERPADAEYLADVISELSEDTDARSTGTDGAIALYRPQQVFATARNRVELVFKIRLAVALLIFGLLLVTVSLAIYGLATGNTGLAGGLGTAAVADLLVAGIYKPLEKVSETLRDTQRLDLIHTMTEDQLRACQDKEPADRFECQQRVWTTALDRLATLEGRDNPTK